MGRHIVCLRSSDSRQGRCRQFDRFDESLPDVVFGPDGEIVIAGGVAHFTVGITDVSEIIEEVSEVRLSFTKAESESKCIFNESGAIHALHVDHQLFVFITVEGVSHIWLAQELSGNR